MYNLQASFWNFFSSIPYNSLKIPGSTRQKYGRSIVKNNYTRKKKSAYSKHSNKQNLDALVEWNSASIIALKMNFQISIRKMTKLKGAIHHHQTCPREMNLEIKNIDIDLHKWSIFLCSFHSECTTHLDQPSFYITGTDQQVWAAIVSQIRINPQKYTHCWSKKVAERERTSMSEGSSKISSG